METNNEYGGQKCNFFPEVDQNKESVRTELNEIHELLKGKRIAGERMSDIETALIRFMNLRAVPQTTIDPTEIVSFEDLVSQYGGTVRRIKSQMESTIGKFPIVKIGATKGIRKVDLHRHLEASGLIR
jgi:hypothetical protein